MKKFIQTINNIWSIEELRNKILLTLLFVLVYRFGSHVVLPGIDPNKLANLTESTKSGMLGLLDAFVGGAFSKASIFALGIMPYISASIFMQLMTILVPQMQKVQKEGESGRLANNTGTSEPRFNLAKGAQWGTRTRSNNLRSRNRRLVPGFNSLKT